MRFACSLLLVLSLMYSVGHAQISGTNVPTVLRDTLERQAFKYTLWEAEFKDVYQNKNKTFTEAEWNELAGYLMYINTKGSAAGVAIALCETLSQGSYCDEAARDIKVIDEQFKKLEKFDERLKSVRKDQKGSK